MPDYFAYGSNMRPEQMRQRCASAELVQAARLDGHRLAFTRESVRNYPRSGVADLVAAAGMTAWGAVFRMSGDDLDVLDEKESAGTAYEQVRLPVALRDGTELQAIAYTVIKPAKTEVQPNELYLDHLIDGARTCGLPDEYIAFLESLRGTGDRSFGASLVVHPLPPGSDPGHGPLVEVADRYAAQHALSGPVTVHHRAEQVRADVRAVADCPDDACRAAPALLEALGMGGPECFGARVIVRPLGRGPGRAG